MGNKNILLNITLVLVAIVGVIAVISLVKGSNNLKESKKIIETMMTEVNDSKKIVKNQAHTIAELQKLNQELTAKVNSVDSANNIIKKSLDSKFNNANKNINEIKNTIANIKTVEFH